MRCVPAACLAVNTLAYATSEPDTERHKIWTLGVSSMIIREFDEHSDLDRVRDCLIELQDSERMFDPRMPSGADIVDKYIPQMLERCKECQGIILVAEVDGDVAGYATVFAKVRSEELEDGGIEFGLVSDLVVTKDFRGRGLGRQLLEAAESYARASDVNWLRIGMLAGNQSARNLYTSMGFSNLYVELEKDLTG